MHSLLFFRGLSDQQDRFAAAQLSMQAEQARQQEAQTLVLEGIRQRQEDIASAAVLDSAADVHILFGMFRTALLSHWTA